MCEICSKLTIKTPDQHHRYCSGVFIVNLEQISYTVIVELGQVNADWEIEELKTSTAAVDPQHLQVEVAD